MAYAHIDVFMFFFQVYQAQEVCDNSLSLVKNTLSSTILGELIWNLYLNWDNLGGMIIEPGLQTAYCNIVTDIEMGARIDIEIFAFVSGCEICSSGNVDKISNIIIKCWQPSSNQQNSLCLNAHEGVSMNVLNSTSVMFISTSLSPFCWFLFKDLMKCQWVHDLKQY